MRYSARTVTFFTKLKAKIDRSSNKALQRTCALIRNESIEKMRRRPGPSRPGSPPHHHIKPGLKAILYDVQGNEGIIGPRKFKNSRFFNRPVPNIHEFGGIAMGVSFTGSRLATYPERSFMYSAVQNLQRKGKINPAFSITFRRYF